MTQKERLLQLLYEHNLFDEDIFGRELADNIADNLLSNGVIVPPCKVGDTVYVIANSGGKEKIISQTVKKVEYAVRTYPFYLLEANIWMSKSEAEQALRERDK